VAAELRYHPSEDQLGIAAAMDESLADLLPLSRLHSCHHEDARTWAGLEEIGVFSIGLSEEAGGSGLGVVEEALIVMSLGRHLASPGVLATVAAAQAGSGKLAAAYRHGKRIIVVDEPGAELLLLRDGNSAALHRLHTQDSKLVDEHLWLAVLREIPESGPLVRRLDDAQLARLRLLDAAGLAGIAAAALDMSVAYAGLREQFGRPIGSFQAVKHHCADSAIAARGARDQVGYAAVALAERRADALLQCECALYVAGIAALENAGRNIQIHGGMGFSDEADPHLLLKRAQLLLAIAGGLDAACARIAAIEPED
jgi:alkylation response protein AidB-like acyl-CoA dehydrogenase